MARRSLTFIIALLAILSVSAQSDYGHFMFKRDGKLPFDTLPNTNCGVPEACSNIQSPYTCRCSGLLTVCRNDKGFCWGSQQLNQNTGCPAVPTSCSSQFNGTASCLCDSSNVLCVDRSSQYCFGTYSSGGGASAQVSLAPLPGASAAPSNSQNEPSSAHSLIVATFWLSALIAVVATHLTL